MGRHPGRSSVPAALALVAALLACGACGPTDPLQQAREERAQWSVQLLSWAATEDGRILLSLRLSGPVHSVLERLTVRLGFQDMQGQVIGHRWLPLDVSEIQRGGPEDVTVRVPAPDGRALDVQALSIEMLPQPTPEQAANMPELNP